MPEAKEETTTAPAAADAPAAEPAAATETPAAETNGTPASTEETKEEETKTEGAEEKKEDAEAKPSAEEEAKSKMTGRVMIVTGASSGLGFAVANYLCEGGNDVILACRNEDKANRAIEKIKAKNPNALAAYMNLDVASFESVRKFVSDFQALEKPLHVLINNAGVCLNPKDPKRQISPDNLELTMATNHFGPFLLTNLLLENLKSSSEGENGEARVVFVSHDPESMKRRNKHFRDLQPLDLENVLLYNENTYGGYQAYKNSKAANILTACELARRLEGTNVTVNAVCPGFVPSTDLMRNASGMQKFFNRYVLRFVKLPSTRTIHQGAQAIINVATDEKYKGVTGKYIKDNTETQSSEETRDEENQKKLFELSGGYVKLEGFEPIEIPEPPKEEEKKKEEKKEEAKAEGEEAAKEEEGDAEKKDDDEKKDDEKKEGEEKEAAEEKKEEVKDEKKEIAESEKKEETPAEKKE